MKLTRKPKTRSFTMEPSNKRYVQSKNPNEPFFRLHEVLIISFMDLALMSAHIPGYVERVIQEPGVPGPATFDFGFRNRGETSGLGGRLTLSDAPLWRYLVTRLPNLDELKCVWDSAPEDVQPNLFYRDANGVPMFLSVALENYTPPVPSGGAGEIKASEDPSTESAAEATDSSAEDEAWAWVQAQGYTGTREQFQAFLASHTFEDADSTRLEDGTTEDDVLREQVNEIILHAHHAHMSDGKLSGAELTEQVETTISEAVTELTDNEWRATAKTRVTDTGLVTDVSLFRVEGQLTFHMEAHRSK